MIEPDDITLHLQRYLPVFTDMFSDTITATATVSGTTVTVTSVAHGLVVTNKITVGGGDFDNSIAGVVDNGDGTVRFTTDFEHDLTEPKNVNDPTTLTLSGIGSPWDGVHTIDSIPNRMTFEIEFPTGVTVLPDISTANLVEDRAAGIIGFQEVATVPDADTFTFDVANVPDFPTGAVQSIKIAKNIRIAAAENINRADDFYTAQSTDDAWLFVIMQDVEVSKDRHTLNDGVATYTNQNLGKQTILQNFSTAVILGVDADASGSSAMNKFYGEIYRALVSALYGFFFDDTDTATRYVTVATGHGPATVQNTSYSMHAYDWQIPSVISYDNGFLLQPDVAFRDIVSAWANNSDDEAIMNLGVDLDDEPL